MPKPAWYLLIMLLALPFRSHGQIAISGVTRDSASYAPIPFVSIQVGKRIVVISDKDGLFQFTAHIGDTSVFTHMTYKTKRVIHFRDDHAMTVLLAESVTLLKSVTVVDNYKPQGHAKWRDYIILPSLLQNPGAKDEFGQIQTFGVGGKISGPISYFTKYEKERRKIKDIQNEMAATQIFREIISSEKTKADLIQLFSITETQYFKKIETFNIKHPDAAFLKSKQEIMNMLIAFFALKDN